MRTLEFTAAGQELSKAGDFSGLVRGTRGYLKAHFAFDSAWDGYKKAACFRNRSTRYYEPIINGTVKSIDAAALTFSSFYVSVIGEKDGARITTNEVEVTQR